LKADELKTDKTILDWFRSRKAAQNTQNSYLMAMQFYTEFTGMTPDELLEEAEQQEKDNVLMRKRAIKKSLARL
jgi:hypothetical protein